MNHRKTQEAETNGKSPDGLNVTTTTTRTVGLLTCAGKRSPLLPLATVIQQKITKSNTCSNMVVIAFYYMLTFLNNIV